MRKPRSGPGVAEYFDNVVLVGVDAKIARNLERLAHDRLGIHFGVREQRPRRRQGVVAARADRRNAALRLDHVAVAREHERRLGIGHDHHGLKMPQRAVRAPELGKLNRSAHQVAGVLLEHPLKPLKQREGIGRGAGKAHQNAVVKDAAHLARGRLEDHVSQVGVYTSTVGEDTTLVNTFATDAFREACEMAYAWSQAGYSNPEGSANTLGHDAVVMSGQSKGVIMGHSATVEGIAEMFTENNTYGGTFDAVQIAISDMTTNTLTYGVAYTSENVADAAKMMSLIWTDEFIASSLIYGAEDVSYVWNDDHTFIEYPEGLDMNTVPYTNMYTSGAFGNQFLLYPWDEVDEEEDNFPLELMEQAWYPKSFGFIPDSSNVSTQVAAVSNVYDQYYDVLTYGDVDPAEYLPMFLSELETAGINDIIAEYQTQLDAWLETLE